MNYHDIDIIESYRSALVPLQRGGKALFSTLTPEYGLLHRFKHTHESTGDERTALHDANW